MSACAGIQIQIPLNGEQTTIHENCLLYVEGRRVLLYSVWVMGNGNKRTSASKIEYHT